MDQLNQTSLLKRNFLRKAKMTLPLVIGLFLIIFLVTFFQSKKEAPPETTPELPKIPTPNIEKNYKGTLTIKFDVNVETLNLPTTLPIYTISKDPLTEDKIALIAKSLGFSDEAFTTEDPVSGLAYIYYSDTGRLRILPYSRVIDYKIGSATDNAFQQLPDDQTLKNIASDFLVSKGLVENKNEIQLYKIQPLALDLGGHHQENAQPNIVSVTFVKKASDYPIISATLTNGSIDIRINSKKAVISVFIDDIPEFFKDQDYPLKSYEEIKAVAQSQSFLQDVGNGKYYIFQFQPGDIQKISINEIKIAYLQENDPDQLYLQPVFLLKGTATLKSGETESVTLYLPAISYEINN